MAGSASDSLLLQKAKGGTMATVLSCFCAIRAGASQENLCLGPVRSQLEAQVNQRKLESRAELDNFFQDKAGLRHTDELELYHFR